MTHQGFAFPYLMNSIPPDPTLASSVVERSVLQDQGDRNVTQGYPSEPTTLV